jgi:hypothetical protein
VICSVLIPSRSRIDRLRKTLRSIHETSHASDVEILVRFDDDDHASLDVIGDLTREHGIRVLTGPRRLGYLSLGEFYAELAAVATGTWIWIMNDDAYVTGPPTGSESSWDVDLQAIQTTGEIVQPECYQLGHSKYWSSEGGAFPIVPNRCWERFSERFDGGPSVDIWLDRMLRARNGWKTRFLSGIAVVHERDADDVLAKHREIRSSSDAIHPTARPR